VLAIIFLFILGIINLLYFYLNINLREYLGKEKKEKEVSFLTTINLASQNVSTLAKDYTYWDEMVEFVKNKDLKWAEENLIPSLGIYKVDFVWVYDLSGALVYFTTQREDIKEIKPLKEINKENIEKLFSAGPLKDYFLQTDYGLLQVSSATIHPTFDSERKTPAQGYFFVAKLWDEAYLNKLKEINRLNLFVDYCETPTEFFLPSSPFTIMLSYPLKGPEGKEIGFLRGWREETYLKWLHGMLTKGIIFLIIFLTLLLLFITFIVWNWVANPLRLAIKTLHTKEENYLGKLIPSSQEFAYLKESISDYLKKERALREELETRKNTEERLIRLTRILHLISEVNQLIVHVKDIEKLFVDVCRLLVEKGDYHMVWIGKVNKEKKSVEPLAWWGYVDGYLEKIKISIESEVPEGRGPTGEAVRSGKYFVCNDIEHAEYMAPWREEALKRNYRSSAAFPLRRGMEVIGVLNVYSDKVSFFVEEEIKLLNELANDISFAIDYLENEELLRLSEERYRLQFEEALDGIVIAEIDTGIIVDCNSAMARMVKRDKKELIGQPQRILHPPEVCDGEFSITFKLHRGEKLGETLEDKIITKDGEIRYVSIKANKIKIGQKDYMQGVFRDITEMKKLEFALKESEAKFRALAENSPDTIMRFDREYRHLYVNPKVEKETGIPPAHFIGKTHRELGFPEELCQLWETVLGKVFETGKANRIEFQLPSGIWIDWFLVPEFDESGKVKAVITSARDITEKKKKEEEFKKLQAQLVQSAKLASLGQLSAGIAHEINNPLTGILNNVELIKLLLEERKELSPEKLKEAIFALEEFALRCKKIVQNMLSFSRTTKGIFEHISLNEVIENTCSLLEKEYNLQGVSIEKNLKPNLPFIIGDRQLLQQMLLDMLNNSFWAIKKKGDSGVITLTTDYEEENKQVILYISDTGIGIAPEDIEHIFEPFFTTKEPGEGTGLGLAIVHDIIKRHNATVSVESKVNVGTTFKIVFTRA